MTGKQLKAIVNKLCASFPSYDPFGSDKLLRTPVHDVMQCIYIERSSFDKDVFQLGYCVQPLYMPIDVISIGLGERLPETWLVADVLSGQDVSLSLKNNLDIKKLMNVAYATDVIEWLHGHKTLSVTKSYVVAETLAYSYLYCGEFVKARQAFEALVIHSELEGSNKWQRDILLAAMQILQTSYDSPQVAAMTLKVLRRSMAEKHGILGKLVEENGEASL